MSVHEQNQVGKVRVFCCGGAGINVGLELKAFDQSQKLPDVAEIHAVYVDTSRSNLARARHNVSADQCYLIEGLDGSGKIRSENHEVIQQHARSIIQEHRPMDLNVVVSSGSGGSGSVLAPVLVRELLDRGLPTVVFVIGSTTTRLEIENTLKTLKSYDAIANMTKVPVVAVYLENSEATPHHEVDREIIFNILSLSILFSRQNRELDSRDLLNWVRHDKATSFGPRLSALTIYDGRYPDKDLKTLGNIISVATIVSSREQAILPVIPEYQCVGIVDQDFPEDFKNRAPYHFIISDGVIHPAADRLNRMLKELSEAQNARIMKNSLVDKNDVPTEGGLIL